VTRQEPSAGAFLWRDRDFRTFMAGRLVTEVGSRITREGLPIVAILSAGATAPGLGVMAAVSYLAVVALAPASGVLADRRRRRPIMIAADLVRAALLATVPLAALAGRLTFAQMLVVTGLVAGVGVFFDVADRAWLPDFVGRKRLAEGNAAVSGASGAGETVGPVLMGALIQGLGGPAAVGLDALSYVASALSLALVRRPEPPPRPRLERAGQGAMAEAAAGYRAVATHPVLRPIVLTLACQSLFGGFFSTLYELYALDTLHQTPLMIGLLVTGGGMGALAGSAASLGAVRRFGMGRTLVGTAVLGGAINVLVPVASGGVWAAFAALLAAQFLGDLMLTVFEVGANSVQQTVTPGHWLGRVNAMARFLGAVLGAAGALLSGALAAVWGPRALLAIAAVGLTASGVWLWRSAAAALTDAGRLDDAAFGGASDPA
jgi:hypothetical protein